MREVGKTDVVAAVTIALLNYREGFTDGKVPVGEGGVFVQHVHIDHDDEPRQIQLRLSDGSCWIFDALPLSIYKAEKGVAMASYRRYAELLKQHNLLMNTLQDAGIGHEQTDLVHQAWFEKLPAADRDHWVRWMPGGYAVQDDWDSIDLEL
jgi:hypothetical protein